MPHAGFGMTRAGLDLNLIPLLRTLVSEKSVTRTAAAHGLSQPQASRALARLRSALDDPVLLRTHKGMEPTPKALALVAAFDPALEAARVILAEDGSRFDPAVAQDTFRVSMNDYESSILVPALHVRLAATAPSLRVAVTPVRRQQVDEALKMGQLDLAIGRFLKPGPNLRRRHLFDDDFVGAVGPAHPFAQRKPTVNQFIEWPHVLISPGGTGDFSGLADEVLARSGLARRVTLSTSQFLVAPLVVGASDAVLVCPRRLSPVAARLGLRPFELPIVLPRFQVSMLWHERSHRSEAQRWLRAMLVEIAKAAPAT